MTIEDLIKDAARISEAHGRAEGIGIGEARGMFSTLSGLVKDGILTVPQAAARMNISVGEFRQRAGVIL